MSLDRSQAGISDSIPPWDWMSVSCECCVLSGRGHCDGPVSSRGDPSSVVCVSVIEEPYGRGLGPLGLSSLEREKLYLNPVMRVN